MRPGDLLREQPRPGDPGVQSQRNETARPLMRMNAAPACAVWRAPERPAALRGNGLKIGYEKASGPNGSDADLACIRSLW